MLGVGGWGDGELAPLFDGVCDPLLCFLEPSLWRTNSCWAPAGCVVQREVQSVDPLPREPAGWCSRKVCLQNKCVKMSLGRESTAAACAGFGVKVASFESCLHQ